MSEPVKDSLSVFYFIVIHSEYESVELIAAETFTLDGHYRAGRSYTDIGKRLIIACTHNNRTGELIRKACQIKPCDKASHTVTYQNIRESRILLFHYHGHTVKIVNKVAPAVFFRKVTEVVIRFYTVSMSEMIVTADYITV